MYVEDIFLRIRNEIMGEQIGISFQKAKHPFDGFLDDPWHLSFIESVGRHIDDEKPLSTKQCDIILKLIRRVKPFVVHYGWASNEEVTDLLEYPSYRKPPYQSYFIPKEVRHLGGNLLAFKFKYHPQLTERVRTLCNVRKASWFTDDIPVAMESHENITTKPFFDDIYKIWIVPVFRFNIGTIVNLISEEHFGKDSDLTDYLVLVQKSCDKPSTFVVDEKFGVIIANVCDNPLLAGWITEIAEGMPL